MKATKEQANEKLKVIKLFGRNYTRDLFLRSSSQISRKS